MAFIEIIIKFALTFVLSFLFGIERQRSHKPIGFGTFVFVAVGSCALGIVSIDLVKDNPLPLLGATVTGIGFLGAGALIKTNDKIFGVTTAASIWIFAILGIIIGIGEYFVAVVVYLLIWAVILYDNYLERNGIGLYQKKIFIKTNKIIDEKEIKPLLLIGTKKFKLLEIDVDKRNNKLTMAYLIEGTKEEINRIPKKLFEKDWFDSCRVE